MKAFAAIFDWDGVVIDSSAQHERSWELLAEEIAQPLPEGHFKRGFGMKNQFIIPNILNWTSDPAEIERLSDRKEVLFRELAAISGVTVLPGARELLRALKEAGIPRSVGSSTPRANLDAIFAATGLGELFDAVVSANDVSHGKPDPEVFLKAASFLKTDPARCVVFEDALVGIEAARRGGMKVVAVSTTNPRDLLTHADRVVDSLAEVAVADLETLFA